MGPTNRLREIFSAIGLETVRPTDELLEQWGTRATRFNQLVNNRGRIGITVSESRALKSF
ncbi:hypothetical protein [Hymenobacter sp. BRD67]|uniref:hypothetical protein n=1 Tax=Hymenobacter sp. BRD67 TaxID=2675877 RepID=UPI001563B76B|nr:hypothetical protein [Hymenobacter sp. BRD67]QKG52379.1 hypothetical protein GKZ67_06845 [Hymenobacter sp. BRD67]